MWLLDIVKPWVVYWEDLTKVYEYAKKHNFAIPAINTVGTHSINAVLEAAKEAASPIIIQFSQWWWKFIWGTWIDELESMVLWTVSWAIHVHTLAVAYWVVVILHTDHANKKALPWIDGLILENKKYYEKNGRPLFSSHMLDLSIEPLEDNITISKEYFKKLVELEVGIEIEVWITWGEEEWADTTSDKSKMYTSPEELDYAYSELKRVWDNFTIAAMFGNVHWVYSPWNVDLKPKILDDAQRYISAKHNTWDKPLSIVFHGWSWSDASKIQEAIWYWVVKMNVDTDTQWAFSQWTKKFMDDNSDYLKTQIWNPQWGDIPNKKYYDPRKFIGAWQKAMKLRVLQAFKELNSMNKN